MSPAEFVHYAKIEMFHHGLRDWTFKLNSNKRRMGVAKFTKLRIEVSKYALQNPDGAKNTLLHEIAHALVGPFHGHNQVWRQKALEIGCNGERCHSHKVEVPHRYIAYCPNCGLEEKRHRRARGRQSCGQCSPKVFNERYLIQWKMA